MDSFAGSGVGPYAGFEFGRSVEGQADSNRPFPVTTEIWGAGPRATRSERQGRRTSRSRGFWPETALEMGRSRRLLSRPSPAALPSAPPLPPDYSFQPPLPTRPTGKSASFPPAFTGLNESGRE